MELVNDFYCFPHIQGQRSKGWVHVNLRFLAYLILGDLVKIGERLMHECCHIGRSLQDLGISTIVDELQDFFKNLLDVSDLLEVRRNQRHFGDHFLLLCPEALLKVIS